MNQRYKKALNKPVISVKRIVMLLIAATTLCSVHAQQGFYFKSVKGYIQGTSSLHDWRSEITKIDTKGYFQVKGTNFAITKAAEIRISVEGIKSKEGKIMDNKTYEAFKSAQNPFIIYAFKLGQIKTDSLQGVTVTVSGSLTMAGITRPVMLVAKGKALPNGDLQLVVSQKLKMTEFNMIPPKAVLGTIKVANEVTVSFTLVLAKSA